MQMEDGATSMPALAALRDKYLALITLRTDHAAGAPPPDKQALRALAARFPGALRELDQRSMQDLLARRDALVHYLAAGVPSQLPAWATLQIRYHGIMRAVLRLKAAGVATPEQAASLLADLLGREGTPGLSFWDARRVALVRRPPAGRLNPLVIEWTAEICGVSTQYAAEQLLPQVV